MHMTVTDRWTDTQTDRQAGRQTDRQTSNLRASISFHKIFTLLTTQFYSVLFCSVLIRSVCLILHNTSLLHSQTRTVQYTKIMQI
jgi:hypothetical protein